MAIKGTEQKTAWTHASPTTCSRQARAQVHMLCAPQSLNASPSLPWQQNVLEKPPSPSPLHFCMVGALTVLGWSKQRLLGEGATICPRCTVPAAQQQEPHKAEKGARCELGYDLSLVPLVPTAKPVDTGE